MPQVVTGGDVLYELYDSYMCAAAGVRTAAGAWASLLSDVSTYVPETSPVRALRSALELTAATEITHVRRPFGIASVLVDGEQVPITERPELRTPFCTLLHFDKARPDLHEPKVLLVAPLSGHFATLLRPTVATLARDHDVYLTDWHNARDVPLADGRFGYDQFVDHLLQFMDHLGPEVHVVAVCQPCVPVLEAVAVRAQTGLAGPATLTLMAGPVDGRVSPTEVNQLALDHDIGWFERRLITRVSSRHPGAGRRVYPGFLQLAAFMSMNPGRHVTSHLELYADMVRQQEAEARATRTFYDEYFTVLDMAAEFYLETVQGVFQEFRLARGVSEHHGRLVEPSAIRRTALLTIEGERDDICAPGQTLAAQDLCSSLRPAMRRHHLQAGVGHYGVFSGRRWEREVYPVVRSFILSRS